MGTKWIRIAVPFPFNTYMCSDCCWKPINKIAIACKQRKSEDTSFPVCSLTEYTAHTYIFVR